MLQGEFRHKRDFKPGILHGPWSMGTFSQESVEFFVCYETKVNEVFPQPSTLILLSRKSLLQLSFRDQLLSHEVPSQQVLRRPWGS